MFFVQRPVRQSLTALEAAERAAAGRDAGTRGYPGNGDAEVTETGRYR